LEHSRSKDSTCRGDKPYWSAYRKARGVQVKTYLGQDLTIDKLEAAAAHVAARLKEKLGLSEQEPLLTTRFSSQNIREQEHKRHLLDQIQKKDHMIADLKQELEKRNQMIAQLQKQQNKSQGKRGKPHPKRS
jgi:DNA-directed RNA polymerase specialized sigma subunit